MKPLDRVIIDLLRAGDTPDLARSIVAKEVEKPPSETPAALLEAALGRPAGVEGLNQDLLLFAMLHLVLQVPPGPERVRLEAAIEEYVAPAA